MNLTTVLRNRKMRGATTSYKSFKVVISAGKIDFLFVLHIYAQHTETLYAIEVVQLFLNVEKIYKKKCLALQVLSSAGMRR